MSEVQLTRERILEAAEDVLRRFGPSKATVVDVARALGVSHGSVYRHFASKAELRDAVTRLWLARVLDPLEDMVTEDGPASDRLYRWLLALMAIKRHRLAGDPELFATYGELAAGSRDVVQEHMDHMTGQIGRIISDGVARGEFASKDPAAAARAVLFATARFHHPAHASEWCDPGFDAGFDEVWSLILCGLQAKPKID